MKKPQIYLLVFLLFLLISCFSETEKNYDEMVVYLQPKEFVRVGDYFFKTAKVGTLTQVGSRFHSFKSSQNATLLLVNFQFKLATKESKSFNLPIMEIIDRQGVRFSPSNQAMTAFELTGGNVYSNLGQMHPGIEKDLNVIFEVPESVLRDGYAFVFKDITQYGFFVPIPDGWKNTDKYKSDPSLKKMNNRYFQKLILNESISDKEHIEINNLHWSMTQ